MVALKAREHGLGRGLLGIGSDYSVIYLLMCIMATSLTGSTSEVKYRSTPVGNRNILYRGWGCHATGKPRPGYFPGIGTAGPSVMVKGQRGCTPAIGCKGGECQTAKFARVVYSEEALKLSSGAVVEACSAPMCRHLPEYRGRGRGGAESTFCMVFHPKGRITNK